MCRLLGLLTTEPEPAEPWLVGSDRSLLTQSNVSPETRQKDGWGIAWFDAHGRARVERGTGGAYEAEERPRFLSAAAEARSTVSIGHLRHASNPLNLPREQLIGIENSQPFTTHTAVFAHNGSIPFPTQTRPYLGVHEGEVKGVNDSEVLFRLLMRHLEETQDPFRAYAHAVDDLVRVWKDVGRPRSPPYSGLNVLFTRGPEELWAFCLSTGDHGSALLDSKRPYYEMAYRAEPHRLLVGSEPFDGAEGTWKSLPSGTYLTGRRVGSHVELTTGAIPVPPLPAPLPAAAPP